MSSDHLEKAPDAYRTISEVAEDLDVPQHVLRFWETRFSQIRPLKRGGGRRYYRPDDVALIKGIRALLYGQGYTIKGVQRILKDQGVKQVQALAKGLAAASAVAEGRATSGIRMPEPQSFDDERDEHSDTPLATERQFSTPAAHETSESDPPVHGLAPALRQRLESALSELSACRQMISVARERQ